MPDIFSLRAIQIYRFIGKYQQARGLAIFKFREIQSMNRNQSYVFMIFMSYLFQLQKTLMEMQKFQEATNCIEEKGIYIYREQNNSSYQFFNLISRIQKEIKEQINKILSQIQLQFAISYFNLKNIEKSAFFIQSILKSYSKMTNKNSQILISIYLQANFLKLKILRKNKEYSKCHLVLSEINKLLNSKQQLGDRQLFKKALQKQRLILLLQQDYFSQFLKKSQQLVELNERNYIFVMDEIFKYAYNNKNNTIQILQSVKSSKIFEWLYDDLFTKLKTFFIEDLKSENTNQYQINQEILKYFDINVKEFTKQITIKYNLKQIQQIQYIKSVQNKIQIQNVTDFQNDKQKIQQNDIQKPKLKIKQKQINIKKEQQLKFQGTVNNKFQIEKLQEQQNYQLIQYQQYINQFKQDYKQFKNKQSKKVTKQIRLLSSIRQQHDNYHKQGFICQFQDNHHNTYKIYFDPNMLIPSGQSKKFMIAATRQCKRQLGHNGIKIMQNNTCRLKIKSSNRLIGDIVRKGKEIYCIFNKLVKHDDYKRK